MVTQLLSRALCKSLLIMLICHLRCPFILPFSRSPDTACRERPLPVDGLKITFWWIRTFTTIHGCPWKCLMTLFFLHKITHKLSLTCRDKLFLYTCSLEVQAAESPAGSSYQHWSSAKHLVFSHNIKESIQNLRILEHPDNLAVCLFSSRSFRFEGITKESNCDWFSFKTLHYIDSCPFGPPRVEQTQWGRSLSERQYTVYCTVQGLFSFGLRAGTSHFSSSSNTPGGWPLQACPPTPAGSTDPARGADHWCLGSQLASCLSCLGPLACLCLAQLGTHSCPSCRHSDLHFQPRMQADKYRTSGRSAKKEMVIESPLQHKDAAQGEVEAESPGPVLVRGSSSATLLPFPTVLVLCACSMPSGPLWDCKTCSTCLLWTLLSLFSCPLFSAPLWFSLWGKMCWHFVGDRGFQEASFYRTTMYCSKLCPT